jgi:hypothetical protein
MSWPGQHLSGPVSRPGQATAFDAHDSLPTSCKVAYAATSYFSFIINKRTQNPDGQTEVVQ